jgi:hypothetical protein
MSWLSKLDAAKLLCRKLGHTWEISYWYKPTPRSRRTGTDDAYPYLPPDERTKPGDRIVLFRCARCETERFDQIAVTGELIRRKYAYATDYARPREAPKPNSATLNAEMLRRLGQDKL